MCKVPGKPKVNHTVGNDADLFTNGAHNDRHKYVTSLLNNQKDNSKNVACNSETKDSDSPWLFNLKKDNGLCLLAKTASKV